MLRPAVIISTFAGTGTPGFGGDTGLATSALLNQPRGVSVDGTGGLYIADTANGCSESANKHTWTTCASVSSRSLQTVRRVLVNVTNRIFTRPVGMEKRVVPSAS